MTTHLRMQWPSAAIGLSTLARHLLTLVNEIHFVEIGLDAGPSLRHDAAKDTVSSIRHALEEAMESDDAAGEEELAARLSALLHALDDDNMSLTACVEQRMVESATGVQRIDVLSIVVAPRAASAPQVETSRRRAASAVC